MQNYIILIDINGGEYDMGIKSFLGIEGKNKATSIAVILILLFTIGFVIYSAMYTIPEATLEKECIERMYERCDLVYDASGYCMAKDGTDAEVGNVLYNVDGY